MQDAAILVLHVLWDKSREEARTKNDRDTSPGHSFRFVRLTVFTGTSRWIDTVSGEYGVLLTNRVHPTRANEYLWPLRREGFKTVFGVEIGT